jgi:hypothetical protein
MLVSQETVLRALKVLTKTGREFHTTELAERLSDELGVPVESDVARYWANQMVLKGVLDRRQISARLYVYRKKKGVNLPSSITLRKLG